MLNNKQGQYQTELESVRGDDPGESFEPIEVEKKDSIIEVVNLSHQ